MVLFASQIPLSLAGSGLFYEDAPFHYSDSVPRDPLARLVKQMESGEIAMDTSDDKAFLKDLLRKLNVPIASQVMVYSKTSFQNSRILPSRPRALYFSEDYYIGWVQGGDIEVISIDPNLGPIFYVLEIPTRPEHKPNTDSSHGVHELPRRFSHRRNSRHVSQISQTHERGFSHSGGRHITD